MEATQHSQKQARDPYFGRETLLSLLDRSIRAAAAGQGIAVLLPGDPGIGKTRTLELIAQRGSDGGLRVVRGGCSEVPGAPPLLPWMQVLRALGREDALEILDDSSAGDASANFRLSRAVASQREARRRHVAVRRSPTGIRHLRFHSLLSTSGSGTLHSPGGPAVPQ